MKRSVAFGKVTLGSRASEAQLVINSGDKINAKADLTIAVITSKNLEVLTWCGSKCKAKAPGCFQ